MMKYRADIDGLRALAVMPVVLFHAGMDRLSGGFIGVDIFFVISGFLITRILLDEIRAGQFSIIHFYERRARRILPALFIVMAFCFVVTYQLYFYQEFVGFAKSVIASLGFSANILFWVESGDYFDQSTHIKPLLHTWSLSVEEQFYVFFPIALLVIHRFIPTKMALMLWLALMASFILSVYGVYKSPKATFYLLPMRAWELLLGGMVAAGYMRLPKVQKCREAASLLGFVLIVAGLFLLDEQSLFPGYNALYPCIGAVLIILAGQDGMKTLVGKGLAWKPVVFIGLISYSLYLWHWPLIVFWKYYLVGHLDVVQQMIVVAVSMVCAALTWHFVERPFRGKGSKISRKGIFVGSGVMSAVFVVMAVIVIQQDGLEDRFPEEGRRLAAFAKSHHPIERPKSCKPSYYNAIDNPCRYGAKEVAPTIALWGDSHSDAFVDIVHEWAEKRGDALVHYYYSGCWPLKGITRTGNKAAKCYQYNIDALDRIIQNDNLKTVILMSRWATYTKGSSAELGPAESKNEYNDKSTEKEREERFTKTFKETVTALLTAGKKVVLVYPTPENGYYIPALLARKYISNNQKPESYTTSFAVYKDRQDFVFDTFDAFNDPNLIKIYPHKKLCDGERCLVYKDGNVLYFDDDHLSLEGAREILPLFDVIP